MQIIASLNLCKLPFRQHFKPKSVRQNFNDKPKLLSQTSTKLKSNKIFLGQNKNCSSNRTSFFISHLFLYNFTYHVSLNVL